jgi:hypothetical protein
MTSTTATVEPRRARRANQNICCACKALAALSSNSNAKNLPVSTPWTRRLDTLSAFLIVLRLETVMEKAKDLLWTLRPITIDAY